LYRGSAWRLPTDRKPGYRIRCEGLAAAARADGLKKNQGTKEDPKCPDDDCWLVAYYVKPPKPFGDSGLFWISGDYHFVRQDSDGDWSHKPGSSDKSDVTRNQWNPVTNNFSGDPITDPSKANVGEGYEFCGYLCVCPKEPPTIAHAPVPAPRGNPAAAVLTRMGTCSMRPDGVVVLTRTDFPSLMNELTERSGGRWVPGFGAGKTAYRLDVGHEGDFTEFTMLVHEQAITVWDGQARHLDVRRGVAMRALWECLEPSDATPERPRRPKAQARVPGRGPQGAADLHRDLDDPSRPDGG